MRSFVKFTKANTSFLTLLLSVTALSNVTFLSPKTFANQDAHAEKAPPPGGEEDYIPPPPKMDSDGHAKQDAPQKSKNKSAPKTKDAHKTDEHASEPDANAAKPAEHESKPAEHESSASSHEDSHDNDAEAPLVPGEHGASQEKSGSGLMWFGIVFGVLLILVFIFT